MKWCPITKSDCMSDCAWFKENRRKHQDHIEGVCSLLEMGRISNRLKEVNDNINKLEQTIRNTDFT